MRRGAVLPGVAALLPALALAQVASLERVVLNASGAEQRVFETPYAVGVVDAQTLRAAGPLVNLSEALARVPGLAVNSRNNYAQDLQISSRGFGARASFGVRGLRLYADGIPASGPDGQGQVSHFDLAGAQRIEVLRGPFSALYGNGSGGAIVLHSAAPRERRVLLDADAGAAGLRQWRFGLELPQQDGGPSLRAQFAHLAIDGWRPHSAARRDLANLRLGWDGAQDRLVLVLNALEQPADDPLGLSRAQLAAEPRQTAEQALPQSGPGQPDRFDTRKTTRQQQAGGSWRHRFDAEGGALVESQLGVYLGRRAVTQWQAIPVATQANPRHSGGVIDFERGYGGLDGRLVWRWRLAGGRQASLVLGAALDRSREDRQGYENFSGTGSSQRLGVTGRLRRNELNRLDGRDLYAQAQWALTERWSASLGLRAGRLVIESEDHYVMPGNPDDSGRRRFAYRNPVAALQWRATPALNLYASAGRGHEAPTLTELAYRNDGLGGFNQALQAQTSHQLELGAKWRAGETWAADLALFDARSRDEIAVASNSGGRASYRNVGRTRRYGAELDLRWQPTPGWRGLLAATWLDARYRDGFTVCAAPPCSTPTLAVPAGGRIAGTAGRSGYAELAWVPREHVELALELRGQGRVPVNDANSDFAAGHGLLALRASHSLAVGDGRLELLGRLENLANRQVVGSVIVNEASGRFFEPAPGRGWLLSLRWAGQWR